MNQFVLRTASRSLDEIQDAKAALTEEFRSYGSAGAIKADPQFIHYSAVLIRELARDMVAISDPTPLMFDRKSGPGLGNRVEIEEYVNTAKVTQRSLGGKPKTFTPHKLKYDFSLNDYRVDFAFELERILTGQQDAGIWVDMMADAVSRFFVSSGLNAIDAATPVATEDVYGLSVRTEKSTAVDTTTLDTGLKRLGDVNPNVVIAGRYSALFPMLGFNGYSDAALEEIRRTGIIGTYKGAQVLVLRDAPNRFFNNEALVPADRIYLIGSDKGGVIYEDDMSALDYETVDVEEQHFRVGTKLRVGFQVFKPWKYHVIEIT